MNYNKVNDLPPRYQKQAEAKIDALRRVKEQRRINAQTARKNRSDGATEAHGGSEKRANKYGAHKIEIDGMNFDSTKEAGRYSELKILQESGIISDLHTQVRFELIPEQRDEKGNVIERASGYVADFVYTDALTGDRVVEDVKGYKKGSAYNLYVIKRKLMLQRYGIRIVEV